MRFFSLATVLAGASMAAASAPAAEGESTTTVTSTTTRLVTVTSCHPDFTDCPLRKTTSTSTHVVVTTTTPQPAFTWTPTPVHNTTSAAPSTKVHHYNTTTPTGKKTDVPTTKLTIPTAGAPGGQPAPSVVPSGSGASGLVAQGGILGMVVLAAAAALL